MMWDTFINIIAFMGAVCVIGGGIVVTLAVIFRKGQKG